MLLNLISLVNESLNEKSPEIEFLSDEKIKVSYKSKYKISEPKPVVLPKMILLNERFAEDIGLYVGDGTLSERVMNHTEFVTIDEDIASFMLNFFLEELNVKIKDITFYIRYRNGDKQKLKHKWSRILGIPRNRFSLYKRTRYNMKDSITIQINSTIFTRIFKIIVKRSLPIIKTDSNLRRAFMRGEFAADGKLGIEKDTNYQYISETAFCYDMKKEVWLRDYIIDCLKLEGINKFFFSKDGDIRITNWKNYIKFWEINLFDRCLRKKNKFLAVIRQMSVRLGLNKNFIKGFLNSTKLSNSEIMKIINLHRTNLKRMYNNDQLLKIEEIGKLLPFTNLKWKDVIDNTNYIRIGRLTNLYQTNGFINFLLNEKNLN